MDIKYEGKEKKKRLIGGRETEARLVVRTGMGTYIVHILFRPGERQRDCQMT